MGSTCRGQVRLAGPPSGHARPVDPARARPWRGARLPDRADHSPAVRPGAEGRGGLALSGPLPPGARWRHTGQLGHVGQQPSRQVLRDHTPRPEARGHGTGELGPPVGGRLEGPRPMMRRLLLKLRRRRRLHDDLEAELAFHREMAAANDRPAALGNTTRAVEASLDLWRFTTLENLWRDVVYGVRGLRRSPALVASAVLSLGLGIGVNTAMFSVGVEFLLSEPSVNDPASIVEVQLGGNSVASRRVFESVQQSGVFQDVAGENEETFMNWSDGRETHRVFSVVTSTNYFTALGIPMALGRGILPSDPADVVVLRHQFWLAHYNGDPSIVGKAILLEGKPHTVVGILPPTHRTLIGFGFSPDVYVPISDDQTMLAIYARLK